MAENLISIEKLKIHPKNREYFSDLPSEKYEEIKRSIEANGIRDPLKVLPDYTIIAGHQRYRIAKELGLEKVPVIIYEISEEEAEYLLIADNEERRQEDNDPIKKAKRAKFLKRYWNIKRGPKVDLRQNVVNRGINDVAEAIGEDVRTTQRLLKLNDLIPEFQKLVSEKKLGTTAAEQLAYLEPETQKALWQTLGEEIGQKKVEEIREMRKEVEKSQGRIRELLENNWLLEENARKLKAEADSYKAKIDSLEIKCSEVR